MTISGFHPAVATWFERRFGEPTEPQSQGWPVIQEGHNTLIASPTGSGKTLSAFLCAIDGLVKTALSRGLEESTRVLYISPLKALANDIQTNLLSPLAEIQERAEDMGLELPSIRPLVRTGDTPASQRRRMITRPPHILVTTPESLYILLTSESGRRMLSGVRTVIVDEIHALARDKRGSHLLLSLERLEALVSRPLQRIGLSATQKPIEDMARFLFGPSRNGRIVDIGHRRRLDLSVVTPGQELEAVASGGLWQEVYDRLADLIREHRTTLIFVNTRRLAERVTHHLTERLGEKSVATHHGSLAREIRLETEKRLKRGELSAVVATASLELGIDVGTVDLVCQIGSTRSIALALQRIGRSGHWKGAIPKGRFFPLSRDELIETAAVVYAIRRGDLDRIPIPPKPLDVLAQQIVAETSARSWKESELYELVIQSAAYSDLTPREFDQILAMLSEGVTTRRGRRGAFLHRDRVNGEIRGRRKARIASLTSGGAIPEIADFIVRVDPEEMMVGTLDEDFAVESSQGDIFLLGNTSWRVRRIDSSRGVVRVEDAHGAAPTVPFWRGEAPARTPEMSSAFSEVRSTIADLSFDRASEWLRKECGLCRRGAEQGVRYVQEGRRALGATPSLDCVVAERFFDESGGMQLVIHSPFGGRLNRAWGLALRKKFCRSFNFELQAAATENGINISLSDQHSFPLDSVFSFLSSGTVRDVLVQAMLDSPLFATRWRWNAGRALQILRFEGGRKVPPALQRVRSDDLLASVFPESAACLENIVGDIEVPDHPLVEETVRDCLTEAMDIEGLEALLLRLESEDLKCVAVDTPEPSPFSHEILNANPYAFLDNAPLEERRARAVTTRRMLPGSEREVGVLDDSAIERVVLEAQPPLRDGDEVHDALLTTVLSPESEWTDQNAIFAELQSSGRALQVTVEDSSGSPKIFRVAAERMLLVSRIFDDPCFSPEPASTRIETLPYIWERDKALDREGSLRELVRARLDISGPTTISELSDLLGLSRQDLEVGLLALEGQGQILRGSFRTEVIETEWCDRRLLARIHSLTLGRLRREIEPVSPADFTRFLFRWQHVSTGTRLHGNPGLNEILDQLQGFELPAVSWETSVLPGRLGQFTPQMLDELCLSGQFAWGRLTMPSAQREADSADVEGTEPTQNNRGRSAKPTRLAPVAFFRRENMATFLELGRGGDETYALSPNGRVVHEHLLRWGACFVEDLVRTTRLLPSQVEGALWELVACGIVTADGFDNLRALIDPKRRRGPRSRWARRQKQPTRATGRWSLLRLPSPDGASRAAEEPTLEVLAGQLLRRWGVVFRDVVSRESLRVPWRDLLMIYRRREARGELRGGRFVSGFVGEQFALPEALDSLRSVRRSPRTGEIVTISAADPLNLTAIISPGPRVRPHPGTVLRFEDGVLLDDETSPLMKRLLESNRAS